MSLGGALSIASSGLLAVQGQITVVSQNVANANAPGYVEETAAPEEVALGDQLAGVRLGAAVRVPAPALQISLYRQNAEVASGTTLKSAYDAIVAELGSTSADTGSTGSLTDLLSTLQGSFTRLQSDPTSAAELQTLVANASLFANGVNTIAQVVGVQRQAAADAAVSDVTSVNQELSVIGSTSSEIARLSSLGQSTASLEDQRDAAMSALSGRLNVSFGTSTGGAVVVRTADGLTLPIPAAGGSAGGPLSLAGKTLSVADTHPGTIPGIMLDGVDVTARLTGGSLGANLALRDTALPTTEAELDAFSATVANRFAAQGLTLFSDRVGALPAASTTLSSPAGIVGFASQIRVNPTIAASPASLLRAAGANAGQVLSNIATIAFAANAPDGTPLAAAPSTGLGPSGTLVSAYPGSGSVADLAANFIASEGSRDSIAGTGVANATALQTSLGTAVASSTSVSIDSEMSKMVALQNSYAANAKIITAVQNMFTTLLNAVNP